MESLGNWSNKWNKRLNNGVEQLVRRVFPPDVDAASCWHCCKQAATLSCHCVRVVLASRCLSGCSDTQDFTFKITVIIFPSLFFKQCIFTFPSQFAILLKKSAEWIKKEKPLPVQTLPLSHLLQPLPQWHSDKYLFFTPQIFFLPWKCRWRVAASVFGKNLHVDTGYCGKWKMRVAVNVISVLVVLVKKFCSAADSETLFPLVSMFRGFHLPSVSLGAASLYLTHLQPNATNKMFLWIIKKKLMLYLHFYHPENCTKSKNLNCRNKMVIETNKQKNK